MSTDVETGSSVTVSIARNGGTTLGRTTNTNTNTNKNDDKTTTYIRHLDGIRALAVTAVLLFHFEHSSFRGGFAGVDVFLTLSGFLITHTIISNSISNFSLRRFYTRRFFRLYPAAALTVLVSTVASYLAFPNDLALRSSLSALTSLLFSSNVYFHARDNYFDEQAVLKPLLHMWSLSLEEQFYFVWAPIMYIVFRIVNSNSGSSYSGSCNGNGAGIEKEGSKNMNENENEIKVLKVLIQVISGLSIVSFSLSLLLFHRYHLQSFVFFHLPPRLFQFSVGALLSTIQLYNRLTIQSSSSSLPEIVTTSCSTNDGIKSPRLSAANVNNDGSENKYKQPPVQSMIFMSILSIISLFTLLFSFSNLPANATPLLTLPTVLATLFLIGMPTRCIVARLLSLSPVTFIGRISYSAYLVHWPLFVYTRYIHQIFYKTDTDTDTTQQQLSVPWLMVWTFALAYVMYTVVESPFRYQFHRYLQNNNNGIVSSGSEKGKGEGLGKKNKKKVSVSMIASAVALVLLIVAAFSVAIAGVKSKGFSSRPTSKQKWEEFHSKWLHLCNPYIRVDVNDVEGTKALRKAGIALGISGDVKNKSAIESDVILFGNSYAGMWRWGLAVIGLRRHVTFKIYQRNGCGLVTLPFIKLLPSHCHAGLHEMWHVLSTLNAGTFVGMSSSWFGIEDSLLQDVVKDLASELNALQLHPFVLADTPGIAEGADRYFVCSEFSWMPLNKVWYALSTAMGAKGGRKSRSAKRDGDWSEEWAHQCVPGLLEEGYAPLDGRAEAHVRMKQVTAALNVPYVDLFKHLCGDIEAELNVGHDITCKVPGNQTYGYFDIGYARDRHHLSVFGSFSLASFLDEQLVQMGALPATS